MDYSLLLPEFVLAGAGFVVLGADLFLPKDKKQWAGYLAILGLLLGALSAATLFGKQATLYDDLLVVDEFSIFFKVFFPLIAIFVILASLDYGKRRLSSTGEYYGLIVFSTLGMVLMTAARELITAYIALELLSFSLYILAAYGKHDQKSNEAGIKYILLGAFSSALFLYGMSLVYGDTLTTSFAGINQAITAHGVSTGLIFGFGLLIAGLGFKVAAVPFHMWAPDTYEGAPTPITAYLSVASKAGGFALLLRLFTASFMPAIDQWRVIMIVLAIATMCIGNLVAIRQKNIKRLLAYSSIAQAGYVLVGVAAMSQASVSAMVLHLAGYAVANLAAFIAVIAFSNLTGQDEISDYAGLSRRAPFVALALTVALFSLAGMPLFAGFVTKFYLFLAVAQQDLLWLVLIAIINSLISLYYYLLVVKQMYVSGTEEGSLPIPGLVNVVLFVLMVGIFFIGVYPSPLFNVVTDAARALFV